MKKFALAGFVATIMTLLLSVMAFAETFLVK